MTLGTKTPRFPTGDHKKTAEAQGKHKKQTGGHGQYGTFTSGVLSLERGEGFVFEDNIVGGAIPKGYIPAVEKGLRENIAKGPLAGFPVTDFKATLFSGHITTWTARKCPSNWLPGFHSGKALWKPPRLLEPIMEVEVTVPEEYLGDIMGDFNSRRKDSGHGQQGAPAGGKGPVPSGRDVPVRHRPAVHDLGPGTLQYGFAHYEEVPGRSPRRS